MPKKQKKARVYATPVLTKTDYRSVSGCELCVSSYNCEIGCPSKCKTGIVRPIGYFGSVSFSTPLSMPMSRKGFVVY